MSDTNIVAHLLKERTVKTERNSRCYVMPVRNNGLIITIRDVTRTAVAVEQLSKHVSAEANIRNNKRTMFPVWSVPRDYKIDKEWNPCGGGFEYLQRDPANRRRRRKESLKFETLKYGHEYQGTQTCERLRWRGPASYTKDRPALSSERAPHTNKTLTVNE
jgi:hypothetical protein